jgi:hypothetical protein
MVTKVVEGKHDVPAEERQRIVDHVLAQLALGTPVSKIFEEGTGLCSEATWYRWLLNDQSLREEVAQAREIGCERHIDQMIVIADDREGDTDPQSRRVRIYAREKAAAMLAPRRFGQRLDVTSGGKPLPAPQSATLVDNRIKSVLMLVQQRKEADEETRKLLD